MKRLRSYSRLSPRSDKVKREEPDFRAVYARVDARSEGRCEVMHVDNGQARCARRGVEHHHLYRPRRAHHTENEVVHICRGCHERTEYPFARGRLVYVGALQQPGKHPTFCFSIRYAASKFAARGQGE